MERKFSVVFFGDVSELPSRPREFKSFCSYEWNYTDPTCIVLHVLIKKSQNPIEDENKVRKACEDLCCRLEGDIDWKMKNHIPSYSNP
jgi:hypothetical protein